ncbi:MAG TPA: hypothetical protein VGC65_03225 [Bacteroidia bacterium]
MKTNIICSIIAATMLFSACSTDLDVVGDYKETIVVYGLLDQEQPKQYIKINKAFLGAGDAYTYAAIKDSTQFSNLTVELRRFKSGAQVGAVITLTPDASIPKEPGIFYSADQTNAIYSTSATLFSDSEYRLTVRNNETGAEITAKTELITDITGFTYPAPSGSTFSFVIVGPYPSYPFPISWFSAKNAKLYQAIIRLNYIDSTLTGNDTMTLDYLLPVLKTDDSDALPPEPMSYAMKGRDFYRFLGSSMPDKVGLVKRTALKVDLMLIAGSDDLSTFIDVNRPSTGIIQERPEFTNINGGLGIFSSRLNRALSAAVSRPMDGTSLDSLACGQYTKHLKFVNAAGILDPCF